MRVDLFVIDGQNDFCDPNGALFVEKADVEATAVADMIKRLRRSSPLPGHKITEIHASMDSHPKNDCSHHTVWLDQQGIAAPPYTIVSHEDVIKQRWRPRLQTGYWHGKPVSAQQWAEYYTESLERDGRAPLCLWPEHCKIGTWGQCLFPALAAAYDDWCEATGGWIDFITKGFIPFTEHYSALRADVIDPTLVATQLNAAVLDKANRADMIIWTGWAGSHCLRWTALDAVNHFGAGENEFLKKSIFCEDASAAVPNIPGAGQNGIPDFAQWRLDFLNEVQNRGAKIMKTTEVLA